VKITKFAGSRLTDGEQRVLAQKAKDGDPEALELLIQSILPALHRLSMSPGFEKTELMNEGIAELAHVLSRYDPNRNCKFLTYAWKWVHGAIRRFVRTERRRAFLERSSSIVEDVIDRRDNARMDLIERTRGSFGIVLATNLKPRQRRILDLLFGLSGHEPVSRAHVARLLKISRLTVTRIEQRALEKLSKSEIIRNLRHSNGN